MKKPSWWFAAAVACWVTPAYAQSEPESGPDGEGAPVLQDLEPMVEEPPAMPEPSPPPPRPRKPVHDPQGRLIVAGSVGAVVSNSELAVLLGAQVGYAVIDGLVPSVRGQVFFGGFSGGEVAGNLMYTPPLSLPLVPFVMFDGGYRWEDPFEGSIIGGGGGLHLGSPGARFNMRAGVLYHRWFVNDLAGRNVGDVDIIRPLLIFSLSI